MYCIVSWYSSLCKDPNKLLKLVSFILKLIIIPKYEIIWIGK